MAQRYGGAYSPDGRKQPDARSPAPGDTATPAPDAAPPRRPYDGKRRTRAGGRVNFLFLAPLPLAVSAFFAEPVQLAMRLVAFGLLILAAWLTREGLIAEEAYHARKIARRPAMPRKIAGALLTGAGLGLAGLTGGGIGPAIIFAVLGAALHAFAFGIDPMRNKGMEGVDEFQTDRVARAVGEAEGYLSAMRAAVARLGDRHLDARVDSFQSTAREMFRTVEDDPRDLTAARKYLTVYLMGARDASVKFADIYARSRSGEARADYIDLLDDLEANFSARTQALLTDDREDLNVEIEVLRDRLSREGVAPPKP